MLCTPNASVRFLFYKTNKKQVNVAIHHLSFIIHHLSLQSVT
jgi:hypothetical protein